MGFIHSLAWNRNGGTWSAIRKQAWTALALGGEAETFVEYTATGNPLSFTTDVAKPLKSLVLPWTPTQSGTPSPTNVRSISGVSSLTVSHSGQDTSNPTTYPIVFPDEVGTVYGGSLDVVSGVLTVEWGEIVLKGTEANWGNYNQGTAFSLPIVGMTTDKYKSVFCDRFAQIKNITSFGVYASASNNYAYFINATDIEEVTDLESWKAYLAENPMEFAYELATPVEIQLIPQQITTFIGDNTIWSDTNGTNTAVYYKKG